MMKREGDSWMSANNFGPSLSGIGINLLVPNIADSITFQSTVFDIKIVYADEDFAVVRGYDGQWLLHADRTYLDHPLGGIAIAAQGRGAGLEIRLYNANPDNAEQKARDHGYTILQGSADKPHGLRECYIIDNDGYVWVPSAKLTH